MIGKMSIANPVKKTVSSVILDLDGTLLNTDRLVTDVLKSFLVKYGKQWDGREAHRIVGKTPLEASSAIVEAYELPCTAEEFVKAFTPMFSDHLSNIKPLPGANRLINHLHGHGIPMALASNSPRPFIEKKLSYNQGWKESFSVVIGGDEVKSGKPSPDLFLEAANRLNVQPSSCLVIEDSIHPEWFCKEVHDFCKKVCETYLELFFNIDIQWDSPVFFGPGVTGGKAAGMEVIAVPSLPKQSHLYTMADKVINSLFDLRPEQWSLPPFEDWIEETLPIEPWHIGGPVIKGFGRGSKVLGIPTANLSTESYSNLLSEYPSGVYFGWAGVSKQGIHKMVMSIGWNPYFNNPEKTIEPWLLHEFEDDFYGEELRLVVVGYIRPEANFPSLESLVAKIYEDRRIAESALELPIYSKYKDDPYFKSLLETTHKS